MRRLVYVLLITTCLGIACRREQPAVQQTSTGTTTVASPQDMSKAKVNTVLPVGQPDVLTQSKLGSKIGPDGNVTEEKTSFKRNEPIYITMWLKESPAGLQTSVHWLDSKGKQIDEEFKPMAGEKVVTFKFAGKKPRPGDYKAVGYWGGNIAAEYDFKITK